MRGNPEDQPAQKTAQFKDSIWIICAAVEGVVCPISLRSMNIIHFT